MNGHVGLVVDLNGNMAQIHFLRGKQCANCGACLTAGDNEMEIALPNSLGAKVGDRVVVDLSPKRVVQASLLAYAVPLAFLIAGVFLGGLVSDWFGLVLGVVACGLAYGILRLVDRRNRKSHSFQPRMERILEGGEEA
ncbi:MAG: SoxR reducing system RseC family protein [Christensenella sp.]|nr:SoxR reducing system RseC family protein [Christensenella sp.]